MKIGKNNPKKKLTCAYLGNWNPFAYSTEKLIKYSLEKQGHEVIQIDERGFRVEEIIDANPDLFFFHKGTRYGFPLQGLIELLTRLTCKKAFWWFDPVDAFKGREEWLSRVVPFVDVMFTTNGTWARRHDYENVKVLRQGCSGKKRDTKLGKKKKEYDYDIAFTGSVYGSRKFLVGGLKEHYGNRFKHFDNVYGRDFNDLCASAKIMIAPRFPSSEYYWSNRIYKTLGAGGFLLHPRCEGLNQEYEDGKHYVSYKDGNELKYLIDYFLAHPEKRKEIAKAGHEKTIKNYTYNQRVKTLIDHL